MAKKRWLFTYIPIIIWLLLIALLMPDKPWYRFIAHQPWGFIAVNSLTFIPTFCLLWIGDRLFEEKHPQSVQEPRQGTEQTSEQKQEPEPTLLHESSDKNKGVE